MQQLVVRREQVSSGQHRIITEAFAKSQQCHKMDVSKWCGLMLRAKTPTVIIISTLHWCRNREE